MDSQSSRRPILYNGTAELVNRILSSQLVVGQRVIYPIDAQFSHKYTQVCDDSSSRRKALLRFDLLDGERHLRRLQSPGFDRPLPPAALFSRVPSRLNFGAARGDFFRRGDVGGSEIGIVAGISHRLALSLGDMEKCWFRLVSSWLFAGCWLVSFVWLTEK
jgi:hypothetical protein